MSSILKALEKAEESSNPRRPAGDSGMIRSNRKRTRLLLPAAVLGGAGVAALVTFAVMGGFSRSKPGAKVSGALKADVVKVEPMNVVQEGAPVQGGAGLPAGAQPRLAPAAPAPVRAATPAPVRSVAPPTRAASAPTAAPKGAAVAAKQAQTHPTAKAAPVAGPKVTGPLRKGTAVPVRAAGTGSPAASPAPVKAGPAPVVEVAPVAPAAVPAAHRPQLKVSGIAYQGNGEGSFAVVNGRAVLQGGTIDGYKVLEIRQDSVKFSGNGGTFEVPLEQNE